LEEGREKGGGNLFTLERNGRYVHCQECIRRGHRQENTFCTSLLKTKYILGLVHKENLPDLNQCPADSVKVGELTSPLGTTLYSET